VHRELSSCAAPSPACGRLEGALVEVARGHADGGGIVIGVDHRAPARFGGEQRLGRVQKRSRRLFAVIEPFSATVMPWALEDDLPALLVTPGR